MTGGVRGRVADGCCDPSRASRTCDASACELQVFVVVPSVDERPSRTLLRTVRGCARSPGGASEDVARAELHADPRADRAGGLGDRVLPGALAGATHHEEVA